MKNSIPPNPLTMQALRVKRRINTWLLRLDDQRIGSHFARAERWLRSVDTSALPAKLQANRLRNLDRLHDYWVRGQFPHNADRLAWRVPIFIDHEGRACAVASLVIDSGRAALANKIAETANYAAVKEMQFPELGEWVANSGFTLDELARVQCSYPLLETLLILFVVTLFGMGGLLFLALTHNPIAPDVNGLVSASIAILMALVAVPASIKTFLKTRHGMELFALPAVLSLLGFSPSALIFILTLLSGSTANSRTLLLSMFNILMLPISWGGLILTNVNRKKTVQKPHQTLQNQS